MREGRTGLVAGMVAVAMVGGWFLGKALVAPANAERSSHPQPERPAASREADSARLSPRFSAEQLRDGLPLEDLLDASEAERLAYFLARFKIGPREAILEAFRLDAAGTGARGFGSYGKWLLQRLAAADRALAEATLAEADLSGPERADLERWLAGNQHLGVDPRETIAGILDGPSWGTSGDTDLARALEAFAGENPAAAFDLFRRAVKERPEALTWLQDSTMLDRMAEAAPQRFRELWEGVTENRLRQQMGNALAKELGERDVAAGLDLLDSMRPSRDRSLAAIHFAAGWGKVDAEAAVAWARDELQGPARLRALAAAISPAQLRENPAQVVEWFRGLPEFDAIFRNDGLDQRVGVTSTGSSGTLRYLPKPQSVLEQALLGLAENDPLAGLAVALPEGGAEIRSRIAGRWLQDDPQAALAWLSEQDRREQLVLPQKAAFVGALQSLPASEVREALLNLESFDESAHRFLVKALVGGVAERSADELLALADGLPSDVAAQVSGPVMGALIEADPFRAKEELDRVPEAEWGRFGLSIVRHLAKRDPVAAFEFAKSAPESMQSSGLYQFAIRPLAEQHWDTARDWYDALPEEAAERNWTKTVIEVQRYLEGESAPAETVATLLELDRGRRMSALGDVFREWAQRDADAAREALEAGDFSKEERDYYGNWVP